MTKIGAMKMIFAFIGVTVVVFGGVTKYVLSKSTAHLTAFENHSSANSTSNILAKKTVNSK